MRILFALLEILSSAVALIPLFLIFNKVLFHSYKKSVIYCIFSFYLVAIYSLVGMPDVTYIEFDFTLNLIPLVGLIADWKNGILNVLLFVPLGIILPIVWKKYEVTKKTVLFGFGMSLAIEILQIFTFRATDINDLITNVFGTFLGFSFADVLMKKFPIIKSLVTEEKSSELYIICFTVVAVMFFVQPFISSIIYELILF